MAALHSALTALAPTTYPEVLLTPTDEAKPYLQTIFRKCQIILDSVPAPPLPENPTSAPLPSRERSSTVTSSASAGSTTSISTSSARSDPIDSSNLSLQKEWGKPIKLSAKDNPHNIAVFKLSGKDGKGAWFARRSVHEGMGFRKWKLGLQREFPESLAVQGEPGEGGVRGIGGDRKVTSSVVEGIGGAEVYHLSAQFPGPTTPRDFVELLITSDNAIEKGAEGRHYMVVSKPIQHPDCPQRDGFVRGQYESVEFIREIPRPKPRRSMSATGLRRAALNPRSLPEDTVSSSISNLGPPPSNPMGRARGHTISFAESRGAKAKGENLDHPADEEDELNPVEWIMVTRSDPGGAVPRFMVERGSPGSIVADAGKWLEWARTKDHGEVVESKWQTQGETRGSDAQQTNGHLAGLEEEAGSEGKQDGAERDIAGAGPSASSQDVEPFPSIEETPPPSTVPSEAGKAEQPHASLVSSAIGMARSSLEPYAPKTVLDHLPRQPSPLQKYTSNPADANIDGGESDSDSDSSVSSGGASFVSVGDRFEGEEETKSVTDATSSSVKGAKGGEEPASIKERISVEGLEGQGKGMPESPELAKIRQRRKTLDVKFQQLRQKEIEKVLKEKGQQPPSQSQDDGAKFIPMSDMIAAATRTKSADDLPLSKSIVDSPKAIDPQTAKTVEARLAKAAQKHAKETQKQDARYNHTVNKLSQKREKELNKEAARRRKAESKDKETVLGKENEELKKQLVGSRNEIDALKEQLGMLQRENTALVARLGKLDGGGAALWELRQELLLSSSPSSVLGDGDGSGGKKKKTTISSTGSRSSTGTGV